jgi:hypothetical protein
VQDHAQLAVAKQHVEVVVDHRTGALRADVRHDRRGQAKQVQRHIYGGATASLTAPDGRLFVSTPQRSGLWMLQECSSTEPTASATS